ncbi:MAG: pilus assembly protein PilM [Thermodesulfobacteriota bacterium]
MSLHILGIDICTHSVSAVLVQGGISAIRIEGFRSLLIPVDKNDFQEAVSLSLMEAVEPFIKISDRIAVSIPSAHFFFRNARLPFNEQNKIRQILPFEMESTLPYPVEEMILDFNILPTSGIGNHRDIFVAAVEKKILGMYLNILSAARIEPETLTFQGYMGAKVLAKLGHLPTRFIFVDLEKENGTVFLMDSGQIIMARNSSIISRENPSEETLPIVIQQMLLSLSSFYPHDFIPESVIIFKIDSDEPASYEKVTQHLGIPVIPVDLSTGYELDKKVILTEPSSLHPADRGLCMALGEIERIKGMNFLRGPFSQTKRWTENKSLVIRTGILLTAILFLSLVYLLTEWQLMEKKSRMLDREITGIFKRTFSEEKTIIDPYQQMKVKIAELKKKPFLAQGGASQMRRIDIMKEISLRTSKELDLMIGRLTIGNEDVVLSGNTNSFNTVNTMKEQLEGSPLFSQAIISSAGLDRSGNRVDFTLTLKF